MHIATIIDVVLMHAMAIPSIPVNGTGMHTQILQLKLIQTIIVKVIQSRVRFLILAVLHQSSS